jgi:OmpA-OmpF porin, OOP family
MNRIILTLSLLGVSTLYAQNIDKSYNGYDFVAGEKTIFEDNFLYAQTEKITDHWEFLDGGGAATIIDKDNEKVLSMDAFYTRLKPKIFGGKNLPSDFTIEYDAWLDASYDASAGATIVFYAANGKEIHIDPSREAITVFLPITEKNVVVPNPEPYLDDKFFDRWVHFSIAVHNKQMTVYIDQYKQIEISDIVEVPSYMAVWADRQSEKPSILFKNFRLATGFPTALFENGKFVTRNIKFDVNKSVLKPESISTLKQVKDYLDKNSTVKLEINGHTDSDGTDAANLLLSQQRADAVKNQLVSMGIQSDRIVSKGFGESQPIDKNTTAEAKSNNRRVEFIIIK